MRFKFISVPLFCSLVLLLCSCQGNKTTSDKIVTLRMSTSSSEGEMESDRKIFDAFEKSHPNIKIKVMYTPYNSYTEKILVLTVGGTPPDVMWVISDDLPYFALCNVMMDITDRVANDVTIDTTKYFPHALELCSYKGRLYALPRDVCCWFYAYNQDMFDAAKVPYPSTDWTWNDFLDICKKLTKDKNNDGRTDQFGAWLYYWGDVAHQNGGSVLSPNGKECWIDRPEFYEAIQFWANLSLKYHVAPIPSEAGGFGGDLFQNEICATAITGPWAFAAYKKNLKFRYDIVNLPRGKAGNKDELLGLPIAISRYTKHPEEAYELLKFLTYSPEAQSLQAKLGIAMPSRKDLAMSDVFTGQTIMPKHIDLYMKSMMEHTYAPPMFPFNRQVTAAVESAVELVNLGQANAEQAMKDRKPRIDKILRKAKQRGKI